MKKTVLFLGCHCDDIELGCGATIHKHGHDWDIHCGVLCSKGRGRRGYEPIGDLATQSLTQLGVGSIFLQNLEPDHFSKWRQEVYEFLLRLRSSLQPDIVVTQIADEHQDHVTLHDESIRVFREKTLLTYLSSYRSLRSFTPDTYESVDEEDVQAKLRSMAIYRQFYTDKNYLSDESVLSIMRSSGVYIKQPYAETFRTITRIGL